MAALKKTGHDDLLSSWKEIANYLHRGIRTVQRWEVELGLPVRRPAGKRRSAVIAFRAELDEWLRACPQEVLMVQEIPRRRRNGRRPTRGDVTPILYEQLNRARMIQEEVLDSMAGLSRSIQQLYATVTLLRGSRTMEPEPEKLKQQVIRLPLDGKAPELLMGYPKLTG